MGEKTRTTCWRRGATGAGQGPNGSRRRRRRGPRGYREKKGFPWACGRREASREDRAPGHSPRSSAASPASPRAVWGPWSGRGPWDLVTRVRPPISEVGIVLQIKISIARLHQLSVRKITNVAQFSVELHSTSALSPLVLHQVAGFSFYKPSNSPKASQLINVRAGTQLYSLQILYCFPLITVSP